ncbi:MAG: transposase [Opitutales bacterium]|nr:transposase [Opitutales bacterium]
MNKERLLGDEEAKDRFVAELRRVADFCGVQVLTFCVMSNHYHILVRVDPRAKEADDKELVRRFRALYGEEKCPYINMDARRVAWVLDSKLDDAKEVRAHLRGRMGDLAGFMKTLKQRYSVWYNGERGRVGTLWAERYKSCVVQDSAAVLRVVGAYIELNPVRAGLAERAEAYRWSGWGAATGGEVSASQRAWARAGIVEMLGEETREGEEGRRFLESYGFLLRVKDDAGRGETGPVSGDGTGSLLERAPALLRGAVVGTRAFVIRWSTCLGRMRTASPLSCRIGASGSELFHARQPNRKRRTPARATTGTQK